MKKDEKVHVFHVLSVTKSELCVFSETYFEVDDIERNSFNKLPFNCRRLISGSNKIELIFLKQDTSFKCICKYKEIIYICKSKICVHLHWINTQSEPTLTSSLNESKSNEYIYIKHKLITT